eukprot:10381297-Ditylum_brightwellii.AAC.1
MAMSKRCILPSVDLPQYQRNGPKDWGTNAGKSAKDLAYFQSYGTKIYMAKYEIQIQNYKPTIEVNNSTVETEMLAIYALKSHARMAQEMMGWITSLSNKCPYAVKFVPVSLAMDKQIKMENYTTLI